MKGITKEISAMGLSIEIFPMGLTKQIFTMGLTREIVTFPFLSRGCLATTSPINLLHGTLVAIALRMGLDANDLKLITAVVVLTAIVAPESITKFLRRRGAHAAS